MTRKRHGCLVSILVLILLLGAAVALLPRLLSTSAGRNAVLGQVNRRIPGTLEVDAWRLSWTRGLDIGPLRFVGAGAGLPDVEVARIACGHGLLGFARGYPDLGRIEVDQPLVRLPAPKPAPPPAPPPEPATPGPEPGPAPPEPAPAPPKEAAPAKLPPIEVNLSVTGGKVTAAQAQGPDAVVVQELNVQLSLAGPGRASSVDLAANAGDGAGDIDVAARFVLPEDGVLDPLSLLQEAQVGIEALSLAGLQPLLMLPPEVPGVDGTLRASFSAEGGENGLLVTGDARVTGLAVPAEDLRFGDVALAVDGTLSATSAVINEAVLSSGFASLSARGMYGGAQDGTFSADAQADLEQTLTLLRHFGAVPTNLTASGVLHAHAAGGTESGLVNLGQVEAVVTNAEVRIDERYLAQNEIRCTGSARIDPGGGRVESTNLVLTCDLGNVSFARVTLAEDGRFEVSGDVEASLASMAEAAATLSGSGSEPGRPQVDGTVDVPFSLRGSSGVLHAQATPEVKGLSLPSHGLDLGEVKGVVRVRQEGGRVEISRVAATSNGFSFEGSGEVLGDGGKGILDATCDLGQLTPILRAASLVPEDVNVQGKVQTRLAVEKAGPVLRLSEGETELLGLAVGGPLYAVAERDLTLRHTLTADLAARRLEIDVLRLEDAAGQLDVVSGVVEDWSRKPLPVALEANASADLGALGELLRELGMLKEATAFAGRGQGRFAVTQQDGQGLHAVADLGLEDVSLASPGFPPLEGEAATLGVTLLADPEAGQLDLQRAELVSSPVELSATGSWSKVEGVRDIQAAGRMAADLDRVTALLQAATEMDLALSGKEAGSFRLHSRVKQGAAPREVLASTYALADLTVGRVDLMGLHLSGLSVPLSIVAGQGAASIRGEVNRGALALDPYVDFTVEQPVIRLPEGSNALVGVELSGEIADSLLARIHPVFKGAAVVGGTVGLRMDQFAWPLDPARRDAATFAGEFVFDDLELAAAGVLEPILEALKIRERSASLGERSISFACENGRIRTSPTRMRVKGHELVLEGSMGLDQTLDYYAVVPITEELVGREVYAYLQGTTFRLPIRGTASKPQVNLASLQEGLTGLAAQAAQKALEEKAGELLQRWLGGGTPQEEPAPEPAN